MQIIDLGLIPYKDALEQQLRLVEQLKSELEINPDHKGYLVICSHPPIVTLGRQTEPHDLFAWQGETLEISRGGRATYHGPSQIVIYPIISLKTARLHVEPPRGAQEVRGYLRSFELALVETLAEFNIKAVGKTEQKKSDSEKASDETGVWVKDKKIASLGIAVKNWITYHGAALNFYDDHQAFQGINPCGFKTNVMISVQGLLKEKTPSIDDFKGRLIEHLLKRV